MAQIGRPALPLDPVVQEHICVQLAEGRSLRDICINDADTVGISQGTVRYYLLHDEDFFASYKQARDIGVDAMADEILDIADDGTNDYVERQTKSGDTITVADTEHIARSGLRVKARQWQMSKMAPKKFGDKIQQDITNSDGSLKDKDPTVVAARVLGLLQTAQKRKDKAEARMTEELALAEAKAKEGLLDEDDILQ